MSSPGKKGYETEGTFPKGFFWGVFAAFSWKKKSACVKPKEGYATGIISFKVRVIFLRLSSLNAVENFRAQELCESRGGRPGLPSLINLRVLWT